MLVHVRRAAHRTTDQHHPRSVGDRHRERGRHTRRGHAQTLPPIPTLDVLASWFRPGIAAAAAAFIAGLLFGRGVLTPAPASIEAAMAPVEGTGLAALVTAQDPPDASVVFASLVEQH